MLLPAHSYFKYVVNKRTKNKVVIIVVADDCNIHVGELSASESCSYSLSLQITEIGFSNFVRIIVRSYLVRVPDAVGLAK